MISYEFYIIVHKMNKKKNLYSYLLRLYRLENKLYGIFVSFCAV